MPNIARLHDEHVELLGLLKQLSRVIERPAPPPQVELFDLRMKLCATLIGHLKTEDWMVYPKLVSHSNPKIAAKARRFNDQMGGLASDFAQYSRRWSTLTIHSNWPAFCSDTGEIVAALTRRIELEEAELYPLALGAAA